MLPCYKTKRGVKVGISNRFYVKLTTLEDTLLLLDYASQQGVSALYSLPFLNDWWVLSVPLEDSLTAIEYAVRFYETGFFEAVEPELVYQNLLCSDDEYYQDQWGLHNTGQYGGITGVDININPAWDLTKGQGSKVAIFDQGIEVNHPDLIDNIVNLGYDVETNTTPNVVRGPHGTACAGIVGADENNIGIIGVAPESQIIPVSINLTFYNTPEQIANGFMWAYLNGADIISNSWGGFDTSYVMETALQKALTEGRNGKGAVVVFAAGNYNYNGVEECLRYPGCSLPDILVVGATSPCGERKSLSSCDGEFWWASCFGERLDIMAPGVLIPTTDLLGIYGYNYLNGSQDTLEYSNYDYIRYFNGTSSACPHVAGVAALMLSVNPELSVGQVCEILETTATKIKGDVYQYLTDNVHCHGTWNEQMGYGLVNAHKAVLKAAYYQIFGTSSLSYCNPVQQYTVGTAYNELLDNVSFLWQSSSNIQIISNNNSESVLIQPNGYGEGWLQCKVFHGGDSCVLWKPILLYDTLYNNHSVQGNDSILDTALVVGTMIVNPSSILTIRGKLYLTSSARLIVNPGGKLIVDGGILTSACPGEMWQGIEVVGDRTKHQTAANQGTVILRNGATIENAVCGIRTGLREDNTQYLTTGGIVKADTATFRNCAMDVMFLPYADEVMAGIQNNNVSHFNNCLFTVNSANHFAGTGCARDTRVSLWDVCGVKFNGCVFRDSTTGPLNSTRAIHAEDAGFYVKSYCTAAPNQYTDCQCPSAYATRSAFSGFTTAVEADMSLYHNGITIDEALFTNNGTGVFIQGMDYPEVTRCMFDLSSFPPTSVSAMGLRLDACTGYKVEQDTFHRNTYSDIYDGYGIWLSGSGPDNNLLYRNRFDNLNKAVRISGVNGGKGTGLQCTCNAFTGDDYDIYVAPSSLIASGQGSASSGADNTFLFTVTSSFHHAGTQTIDYYHSSNLTGPHAPISPSSNVSVRNRAAANSCASTLCDNGIVSKTPPAGLVSLKAACDSLIQIFENENYAEVLADPTGDTYNATTLAAAQSTWAAIREAEQALQGQTQRAIRYLLNDTVVDLYAVAAWLALSPGITSRYQETEIASSLGLSNSSMLLDIATLYVSTPEEQDEHDNYMDFNLLRKQLSTLSDGRVNWPAAMPTQVAELQRIAEANTGRSSAMAKGVLCFFFDICYEEDGGETRGHLVETFHGTSIQNGTDGGLLVYPNPTNGMLYVALSNAEESIDRIVIANLTGREVAAFAGPDERIDVTALPAGIYLITVTTASGNPFSGKFVKTNGM